MKTFNKDINLSSPKITYFQDGNIESKKYFVNGVLHREDGPAIVFSKNANNVIRGYDDEYYLNDKLISKSLKEYLEYVKNQKL